MSEISYQENENGKTIAEIKIKDDLYAQVITTKEKFSEEEEKAIITAFNKDQKIQSESLGVLQLSVDKILPDIKKELPNLGIENLSFSKDPQIKNTQQEVTIVPDTNPPTNLPATELTPEVTTQPTDPKTNSLEYKFKDDAEKNQRIYQLKKGDSYRYLSLPLKTELTQEQLQKINSIFEAQKDQQLLKAELDKILPSQVNNIAREQTERDAFKNISPMPIAPIQSPPVGGVSHRWNNNGYEYRFYNPVNKNAIYVTLQQKIPDDKINAVYAGIFKDITFSNTNSKDDDKGKIVNFLKGQDIKIRGDGLSHGYPGYITVSKDDPNYYFLPKPQQEKFVSNYYLTTSKGLLSFEYAGFLHSDMVKKIIDYVNISNEKKVKDIILGDPKTQDKGGKGLAAWGFKNIKLVKLEPTQPNPTQPQDKGGPTQRPTKLQIQQPSM